MKIAIFGFGNQTYYRDVLKIQEILGGEPPFGGSRMAMEFAQAGYDVTLADPHMDTIDSSFISKLEIADVKLTKDDIKAAKEAEVAVLFTPFRSGITKQIAETIIPYLAKDAVITTACTMPILVLEIAVRNTLFMEDREDIGFSTMHPAAIPGTPQHKQYFIATNELLEEQIVKEEQVDRLKKIAEDTGKKAYPIPAELVSAIGDMGVVATAAAFASVLEYYSVSKNVLKTTKEMTEFQLVQSFQVMASIIAKYGIEGLINFINPDALKTSLNSMLYDNGLQKTAFASMETLNNIDNLISNFREEIVKKPRSTFLSAPSPMLLSYIKDLAGEDVARGIIREALRKLYEGDKY